MGDNLFQGLPPPSAPPPPPRSSAEKLQSSTTTYAAAATAVAKESLPKPPPPPALKSALKRSKPPQPQPEVPDTVPGKRLRFKTTTDASETQVIEAMQKIASHIVNPSKFGKASKLAIQLIQAGSVTTGTSDYFFSILESAMSSPTACNDTSVRADYHALFSAAEDAVECLSKKQRNQFTVWMIRAVVANDLFTDDSFVWGKVLISFRKGRLLCMLSHRAAHRPDRPPDLTKKWTGRMVPIGSNVYFVTTTFSQDLSGLFSKATGRIKDAISNLPIATKDEDMAEAAALNDEAELDSQTPGASSVAISGTSNEDDSDPFGLDALIPSKLKRDEKMKANKEASTKICEEDKETKRSLKSQREAWILCLEIAARRYKTPWCQTGIDILVKHAFDNISRFTTKQRDAIEKLWASIREQQIRRKQGKSVSGKLDVNGFEWLQQKYSNEKISIRHSVSGVGSDRRAEQWLG
ncbi:hypothetical protein RHSIM_Rhsim05G0175400 [Rhododendron simsii]|uniref:Uncharacterized protein n=1 Tax=Rhododendron simsii TaxID=118357 RepID=A0A834GZ70_RHOSS|nr:hypothetical protein RHSIM_Rhsim05G0175400 [Rhododendron simsii]